MKKLLVFLSAFFMVLCLAACQNAEVDATWFQKGDSFSENDAVQIEIVDARFDENGMIITVQWSSHTVYDVIYSEYFSIERKDGDTWVPCEKKEGAGYIDIAYILSPGGTYEKSYRIQEYYDVSKAGNYRFCVSCSVQSDHVELWAEFSLSNSQSTEGEPVPKDRIGEIQYIRTDGGGENDRFPYVTIIRSVQELEEYYNEQKDHFSLEHRENVSSDGTIGFLDACERYDEAYFAENNIILLRLEESSGSIRHEVTGTTINSDGELTIHVKTICPETGTCDMAQWHIILEFSNKVALSQAEDITVCLDGRNLFAALWVDRNDPENRTDDLFHDLIITKIYDNCFFATSVYPSPREIKINGSISDEWCVGDQVYCTYDNIYLDEKSSRAEADLVRITESSVTLDPNLNYKPVIYLYPEIDTNVSVKLVLDGKLTCTYPDYGCGWEVLASPDGMLTDAKGRIYRYLYWEGTNNAQWDMSKGFCVKGEDTAAFLEDALERLGLNRQEANEFIVFWLPLMQDNPYNVISFQTDAYTNAAVLKIDPAPDTLIRVFMVFRPSDTFVEMEKQELSAPERSGFTVVEWGGTVARP